MIFGMEFAKTKAKFLSRGARKISSYDVIIIGICDVMCIFFASASTQTFFFGVKNHHTKIYAFNTMREIFIPLTPTIISP